MPFYLGVDAGGSKTYAMVADRQGTILGVGKSGCGNYQLGQDEAERNIRTAVETALTAANLKTDDIASAYFGLAGADREADYRILRPMIGKLGFARYTISCDTMIALRAGTSNPYGVVLICGTGVNCGGRNSQGDERQIGGFGYMFGDHGGGVDLAVEAFRAVVRSWEGRAPDTRLTSHLLSLFAYPDVAAMYHGFLDEGKSSVPLEIVPAIFDLALEGDPVSIRILRNQGEELGVTAQAMIRQLGMEQSSFDVVLAGSVVVKGEGTFITDLIEQAVRDVAPWAQVKRLQVEPVVGAVMLAMDEAGLEIAPETFAKLQKIHSLQAGWFVH